MEAHQQLEELVLDRATMETKKTMADKLAQIVYEGKWFTPLREAVQAFVESTQEYVTGEVKFKLYKGNIIKAGTTSPYSIYSESLASFTTGDLYDHHDADGFITLFGLPLKVRAMKMAEGGICQKGPVKRQHALLHIKKCGDVTFSISGAFLYDAEQIGQHFKSLGKDSICFHGKTAPCLLFSPCIRSAQEQGYG